MKEATESQKDLHLTLATIEPPQGLYGVIMTRIELAKRRSAQMSAGLFALLALFSGALLIPILQYTASQLYASGFYEYLTLILSDQSLVLTYWREFSFSLIESLPSLALLLLLPITVALVWSLVRLIKNVRSGFKYAV